MNKALMMTAVLAVSTLCAGLAVNGSLVKDYLTAGPNELIEYRKEIKSGDTLWDVCAKVASNKDNLQELVYNTMRENNISDPGSLQPGEEIIIRVKAVK